MEHLEDHEPCVGLDMLEQLCSRLCHDLAGPIGAIRNGIEFIQETSDDAPEAGDDQALDLIDHSADQAARRLRLFRLAYGRTTRVGLRNFAELRETALAWLAGGRVTLNWLPGQLDDALAARPGAAKLLLNVIMLATDALPHGGVIDLATEDASSNARNGWIEVTASARVIKWPTEITQALEGAADGDTIGPRTIHAAVTGRFAARDGISLRWETPDGETLRLRLAW